MDDITANSANINQILTQADSEISLFASVEKANSIAQLLLKRMEEDTDKKHYYLKAASYVLGRSDDSQTVYDAKTVSGLQESLVRSILEAQKSNSRAEYSDLWSILAQIAKQGQNYSLLDISVRLLKDWLAATITEINKDDKAMLSYANVERV